MIKTTVSESNKQFTILSSETGREFSFYDASKTTMRYALYDKWYDEEGFEATSGGYAVAVHTRDGQVKAYLMDAGCGKIEEVNVSQIQMWTSDKMIQHSA